jgi:hypothetical protein
VKGRMKGELEDVVPRFAKLWSGFGIVHTVAVSLVLLVIYNCCCWCDGG